MIFLSPVDMLIPNMAFSFFLNFGSWPPPGPGGLVLVGCLGPHQLSPFWGGTPGGGLYRPPYTHSQNISSLFQG